MDIFSKVSGLFYTVMRVQAFFLSSFLTYYATKYLVDDLYGTGTFIPNKKYSQASLWKSWDAPVTPKSQGGYDDMPKHGQPHDKHASRHGRGHSQDLRSGPHGLDSGHHGTKPMSHDRRPGELGH